MEIQYVIGDATVPRGEGPKIIAHIVNDVGAWGAGFVLALNRWPQVRKAYRTWCAGACLGATQFVPVEPDVLVANMMAQHGVGFSGGPPIRYDALAKCLRTVAAMALAEASSVHMPRIGCGLAGGSWDRVEALIRREICDQDVPVTVYDLR